MRSSILAVVVLATSGCTSVRGFRYPNAYDVPEKAVGCPLEIYQLYPQKKFREIGWIEIKGGSKTTAEAMPEIMDTACLMGGEGVVITQPVSTEYAGNLTSYNAYTKSISSVPMYSNSGRAVVIVFSPTPLEKAGTGNQTTARPPPPVHKEEPEPPAPEPYDPPEANGKW